MADAFEHSAQKNEGGMMNKKKRQQRAQSLLATARHKQQEKEARKARAVQRAERQWNNIQRQIKELGAVLQQGEEIVENQLRPVYRVTYQGDIYTFRGRSSVHRWLKRLRHPAKKEEAMSWAEQHVWWMIENNCDDFGNPWPE